MFNAKDSYALARAKFFLVVLAIPAAIFGYQVYDYYQKEYVVHPGDMVMADSTRTVDADGVHGWRIVGKIDVKEHRQQFGYLFAGRITREPGFKTIVSKPVEGMMQCELPTNALSMVNRINGDLAEVIYVSAAYASPDENTCPEGVVIEQNKAWVLRERHHRTRAIEVIRMVYPLLEKKL